MPILQEQPFSETLLVLTEIICVDYNHNVEKPNYFKKIIKNLQNNIFYTSKVNQIEIFYILNWF